MGGGGVLCFIGQREAGFRRGFFNLQDHKDLDLQIPVRFSISAFLAFRL